jgi:antirestriction protein ArdC
MNERNTAQSPRWEELLQKAVSEPGIISQAYSRFHSYSFGNQMLAALQCGARGLPLGPIGTFMHWKENGRFVRKGEKAITLCMPITSKRTTEKHNDETGQDEAIEVGYTRFIYRNNWFVLAQTDGAEYTPAAMPEWSEAKALQSLEVTRVDFTMTDGNCQGYAQKRTVAISPLAEHPMRTLLHELAHVVLGHTAERMNDSGELTPRDIRELEAECTAMLVSASLNLPGVEESRGYIQSWYHDNTVPEQSAQRIFSAADRILKAGSMEVSQ